MRQWLLTLLLCSAVGALTAGRAGKVTRAGKPDVRCGTDNPCGQGTECRDGFCYDCSEEGWCNAVGCPDDANPCTLAVLDPSTAACKIKVNQDCLEPLENMQRIYRGAQAYYSTWWLFSKDDGKFKPPPLNFGKIYPLRSKPGPLDSCCSEGRGLKASTVAPDHCEVDDEVWNQPTWRFLDFRPEKSHRYTYSFHENGDGTPGGDLFEIRAVGDLDCDGKPGTFVLKGGYSTRAAERYYVHTPNQLRVPTELLYVSEAGGSDLRSLDPCLGLAWCTKTPPKLGKAYRELRKIYPINTDAPTTPFHISFRDQYPNRFYEPVHWLLRMYRGARRYFAIPRAQAGAPKCLVPEETRTVIERYPDAFPSYLPLSQGITPVEGTCCNRFGGPDTDGDDLCDSCPDLYSEPVWMNLGFRRHGQFSALVATSEKRLTNGSATIMFEARHDANCDKQFDRFIILGELTEEDGSCKLSRNWFVEWFPFYESQTQVPPAAVGIPAGFSQSMGWTDLPWTIACDADTLQTRETFKFLFAEPIGNLQRIADGISTHYLANCRLPPYPPLTPERGTCCGRNGGPDANNDGSCDPELVSWDHKFWRTIGFSISTEHFYLYRVAARVLPDGKTLLTVTASGDLNCNASYSRIERFGILGQTAPGDCTIQWLEGYNIENLFD